MLKRPPIFLPYYFIPYILCPSLFFFFTFLLPSILSLSSIPPQPRPPPTPPSSLLFSDQSSYVGLSSQTGPTLALGDFNADRYTDLLLTTKSTHMTTLHILLWNHQNFSFHSPNPSCHPFSLSQIPSLSSKATIASATTLDADADGYLDVLLSIFEGGDTYVGVIVTGNGRGCLEWRHVIPGVTPGMLVMDANDDVSPDIFFISVFGERVFYLNNGLGVFTRKVWMPWRGHNVGKCRPTTGFNSNAFVDLDGDCLPDLVVSTDCGLEVWLNYGLFKKPVSPWMVGKQYKKMRVDFSDIEYEEGNGRFVLLDKGVWDGKSGDGRATFADFNGDGTIDIAVSNGEDEEVRISYSIRGDSKRRGLCGKYKDWHFETDVALENVKVVDGMFGTTRMESVVKEGDFNFDSKKDILLVDGETGVLSLFRAMHTPTDAWFPGTGLYRVVERILFPITGTYVFTKAEKLPFVKYVQARQTSLLVHIEDPLTAVFFDLDESGRQDILISQQHGTRLIWSSFKDHEDALFFKATAVEAAYGGWRVFGPSMEAFSPLPGNTFQLSYGGRYGRETHVCSQCPQSGFFALQSCSCLFGITRIANYIEEMAIGGAKGVRIWRNLMPNALALVWPQRRSTRGFAKWKIAYLSKGRDGQMKRIILVLFTTLVILFAAIAYTHSLERLEENRNKLDIGYT